CGMQRTSRLSLRGLQNPLGGRRRAAGVALGPAPTETAAKAPRADLAGRVVGVVGAARAAPDPLGDQRAVLGDRAVELEPVGLVQARFELRDEDAQLAVGGGTAAAAGAGEAVPGLGEGDEVRAPAAAVGGEHRADAA